MISQTLENFFDILCSLTPSDVIEIIGIIASTLVSIVAVVISVKSLKQSQITNAQNNRMLEESTRPYITIYLDAITICEQTSYFVLKNFGNSPAIITDFKYDADLKQTEQIAPILQDQFDFVNDIILAPGQSKLLEYDVSKLHSNQITFNITYVNLTNRNEYHETVTMNAKNFIHIPVSRPTSDISTGNERQVHTLREILERSL